MLDTSQVSLIMTDMQEHLIGKLEEEGFIFPSLIVMNKESMINLQDFLGRYPCVADIVYLNRSYEAYISQEVYVTRVTFRNLNNEDDEAIRQAIKEITFRHQPDAIGYFAQCLYKSMKKKEYDNLTIDTMNMDPEAIRIFQNFFYIRGGEEKGHILITPYLLKDRKEEDFDLDNLSRYVVTTFDKTWEIPSSVLKAIIENPYL